METTESTSLLYRDIIGVQTPWAITAVEKDEQKRKITIKIEHVREQAIPCPASDNGACAFAAQFYSSIGFGLSLQKAFEQAKAALLFESPTEINTPILYVKDGINPDDMYIVKPKNMG